MRATTVGLVAAVVAACSGDPEPGFTLRRLASCDDVRERIRVQAANEMTARLERAKREAIAQTCGGIYGPRNGGIDAQEVDPASDAGGGGGGPMNTSGTNNQVAGVDEADFVKAGDGYLYIGNAGKLRILDAWPPEQAQVVSETAIEGEVRKLFVHEGKAVVYSALGDAPAFSSRECTYGYGCSFTGDGRPTKVTVIDLGDLVQPKVIREIRLSGSLIGARRIGTGVHTVVADRAPVVTELQYFPDELDGCESPAVIEWQFARLRRQNLARLAKSKIELFLPSAIDAAQGELGGRCEQFYGADVGDGSAVTSVLSLDLADSATAGFSSIVSRPGALYGSEQALYLAVPRAHDGTPDDEATAVHKFAIAGGGLGAEYRGSGLVPGHVLNQFAMDEYEGDLRIATTSGRVPQQGVSSTVSVLREQGGALEVIGAVGGLAPDEDIRSVRFAGRRGFVVTFKKTDPLFVIDLDPSEAPRVLSELKIPGFSTYMHMLDDTHLLTIGYDASDQGNFAWFTGVLLQIFDVSDPTDPVLAHKHVLGTRGSSSEALTNHLAFTYFAPRQALAMPMTLCEGGQPPSHGEMTFSGLIVYRATAAAGFSELGRVAHPPEEDITCSNWWTDARSQVRRSVFMDDYVFSISNRTVKASALSDLAHDLASIPIDK